MGTNRSRRRQIGELGRWTSPESREYGGVWLSRGKSLDKARHAALGLGLHLLRLRLWWLQRCALPRVAAHVKGEIATKLKGLFERLIVAKVNAEVENGRQ